ncbi:hypothetical protein DSM3645_03983 [Blastopirellula marina DSM 3645]|uniref:Uncharacterized protein n=1 Tax=Blastopirellula marina DSM 3645 TaxID=314230 RepID=A3ZV38_9BACT|nr:hypothetical protein DSM3645_03983 [Blastopirellula marina DSM 3645]
MKRFFCSSIASCKLGQDPSSLIPR